MAAGSPTARPFPSPRVASSLNTQRSIADQYHKEGVHYLRFGADGGKQQFVLVGKDPYVALDKLSEKE
jgi:hypothetical protein